MTTKIEHASAHLGNIADELTQPNRKLADASFSMSIASPMTDLLAAWRTMDDAIARLPAPADIAYGMTEQDATLLQRVLRLCSDKPVTALEAATVNLELRKLKQFEAAQQAHRQHKFSHDEAARDRAANHLQDITAKAFKRARDWIKKSIDKYVSPRPRF